MSDSAVTDSALRITDNSQSRPACRAAQAARPGASAAVLGRTGRRRPAAAGRADRSDRFRANRRAVSSRRRRRTIGPRCRGGPSRRRRCGWPIAQAVAGIRRPTPAGAASKRSRPARSACCLTREGRGAGWASTIPRGCIRSGPCPARRCCRFISRKRWRVARRYGAPVPVYMMTSPVTHDEQVAFLDEHNRFGLPADDCRAVLPGHDAGGRCGDRQAAAGRQRTRCF